MSKSKDTWMQRQEERIEMLEREEDYGRRITMKVTIEITIDDDAYIPPQFMPTSKEYEMVNKYTPPLEDVLREIPIRNIFKSVGENIVGLTVNSVGVETTMLAYYHKEIGA